MYIICIYISFVLDQNTICYDRDYLTVSSVLKRHAELTERLSRYRIFEIFFLLIQLICNGCKPVTMHCCIDNMFSFDQIYIRDSDKMIFERLQREFEAARASQTHGKFSYDFYFELLLS